MIYRFHPKNILKFAVFLSVLQVIVGLTTSLLWYFGVRGGLLFYTRQFFVLSIENTIPTWFSSILLFLCSVLLFCVWHIKSRGRERYRYHWLGLSLTFLLFSIDEVVAIHEKLGSQLVDKAIGDTGGLFYFGWVISGLVFVAIFGAAYFKFLKHLPEQTRWLFLISAGLFISGALGAEMLSGQQAEQYGYGSLGGILWSSLEECLEMCGISLFLYSILKYMHSFVGKLELSIVPNVDVVADSSLSFGKPAHSKL